MPFSLVHLDAFASYIRTILILSFSAKLVGPKYLAFYLNAEGLIYITSSRLDVLYNLFAL